MDAGTVEAAIVMRDLATAVVAKVEGALKGFGKTTRDVGEEVERASSAINAKLGKSLEGVGSSLKSAGMSMSLGITMPLAASGAAALKFAADYENSLAKIQTLSGVAAEDVAKFGDAMLNLGKETATGPNELAKAMLVVTSTGIRGAEALDITKVAAQGAAAGMGEAKDVARAVTSIMTAYGKENVNAATAMDKLFVAVREGGAEANELAGVIGRVVGVGAQLGVSFDEIGAYIATFTRLGVDAAEATTSIGAVMSSILDPTSEAENALASVGLSAEELRAKIADKGLSQTLMDLQDSFKGNTTAMAAVFGNVRALRGVLGNTGAQAQAYAEIVGKMGESTGAFSAGVAEMSKTTTWSWKAMKAQLESTSIAFGQALMPVLDKAIGLISSMLPYIQAAVKAFTELQAPIQNVVLAIGGLVLAAGPLSWVFGSAISTIGKLLGSEALGGLLTMAPKVAAEIGRLWLATTASGGAGFAAVLGDWMAKLPKLSGALTTAGGAFSTFGKSIAGAASTIGTLKLEGLRIVATDAARWFSEVAKGTPVLGTFIKGLGNIGLALKGLSFSSLSTGFSSLMTWVAALATKIPMLGAAFTFLTGPVGLTIAAIAGLLLAIRYLTGSWDFLTKPLKYVADLFSDLYIIAKDKLGKAISELATGAVKQLTAAWVAICDVAKAVYKWFADLWSGAGSLASTIFGPLVSAFSALGAWLLKTFPWLQGLVDGFKLVKAALAEAYGWLAEKFGKALETVGGIVSSALGKWNEWRAGIKKTADEIRAQNKPLEATGVAMQGIALPAAQAGAAIAGMGDATADAARKVTPFSEQLAATKKLLAGLTDEQKKNLIAGLEMKKNANEIAQQLNILYPSLHITEAAVEMFKDGLTGAKEAAKEAKKDLKELKDTIDELSGAKAKEAAVNLATAIGAIGGASKLTKEQLASADTTMRAYFDAAIARGDAVDAQMTALGANVAAALAKANAAEFLAAPIKAGEEAIRMIDALGGVAGMTGDELANMGQILDAGLKAAAAQGKALPGDWQAWKNVIDETVKSLEAEASALAGIEVRRNAALEVAKRYVTTQKEIAKIQQQIADDKWIRTLPAGWEGLAGVALQYRDALKEVKTGQEQANEMIAALGENATAETIAAIQAMVPALDQSAAAMRAAIAAGFEGMIADAGFSTDQIAAVFGDLAAKFPQFAELFKKSGGILPSGKTSAGGFLDYVKTGLPGDIISSLQGGGNAFKAVGASIFGKLFQVTDKAKGVVGGAIGDLAKKGTDFLGKTIGGKAGDFIGKTLGSFIPVVGPLLGSFLGKGIGKLFGGLFGGEAKKTKQMREEFLKTAGGLEEVQKMAKYAGVSVDKLMSTKKTKEFEAEVKKLEAAYKAVQERVQKLTTDIGAMTDSGALMSAEMAKRIRKDFDKIEVRDAFGQFFTTNLARASDGLNEFVTNQQKAADAAAEAAAKVEGGDKKRLEALKALQAALQPTAATASAAAGSIAAVFSELTAGGMSTVDALAKLQPSIDGVKAWLAKAGIGGGEAFDRIAMMAAIAGDAIAGPALQAVAGLGNALTGLANTGLLTQETFAGLASQVGATFNALVAQGTNGDAALQMMQPTLQKLYEMQEQFGFTVDESTQKLIDQAVESGIVGDKFKSAQDRMVDALDRLLGRFDVLLNAMGVKLPAAAGTGADGIERELGNIRLPRIKVPVDYDFPDMPTITVDVEPPSVPGLAAGGIVRKQTLAAVGEKGPEAVIPLPDLKKIGAPDWQAIAAEIAKVVGATTGATRRAPGGDVAVPINWQAIGETLVESAKSAYGAPQTIPTLAEAPEAVPGLAEMAMNLERSIAVANKTANAEQEKPAEVPVNITIQALDPIGLKKVVEQEVAPLLVSAYRRNVDGIRTETRKELVE